MWFPSLLGTKANALLENRRNAVKQAVGLEEKGRCHLTQRCSLARASPMPSVRAFYFPKLSHFYSLALRHGH